MPCPKPCQCHIYVLHLIWSSLDNPLRWTILYKIEPAVPTAHVIQCHRHENGKIKHSSCVTNYSICAGCFCCCHSLGIKRWLWAEVAHLKLDCVGNLSFKGDQSRNDIYGEFNNVRARRAPVDWYLSLFVMRKA